jgi:hypothetical protein
MKATIDNNLTQIHQLESDLKLKIIMTEKSRS